MRLEPIGIPNNFVASGLTIHDKKKAKLDGSRLNDYISYPSLRQLFDYFYFWFFNVVYNHYYQPVKKGGEKC